MYTVLFVVAILLAYAVGGAATVYVCARYLGMPPHEADAVFFAWPLFLFILSPICVILSVWDKYADKYGIEALARWAASRGEKNKETSNKEEST